jgi:hypothetical protein
LVKLYQDAFTGSPAATVRYFNSESYKFLLVFLSDTHTFIPILIDQSITYVLTTPAKAGLHHPAIIKDAFAGADKILTKCQPVYYNKI